MPLVLGIEVAVSMSHLASRMVDISSTDKTELGKHDSSLFGTPSFCIHSGIGPFFKSEKGNKIAYAQDSGPANSVVSLASCFQDLHGIVTVRMLYCDACGGT